MRRLSWDQYRRNRSTHALAKECAFADDTLATIEAYLNDWRGYPSRMRFMPPCVYRRRPQ